jgi:hypothetical protein
MATADGKPNISAQQVKELRDRTGVGFAACREALVESAGDIERAIDLLRKKGQATAAKKAQRAISWRARMIFSGCATTWRCTSRRWIRVFCGARK